MELEEARRAYDAAAKQLLSHKDVLANILKYAVREFKDCTIPEIINCLDGNPEIGTVPVDDEFMPKMDNAGNETVSETEGIRSFDIKFKVKLPNSNDEAELIINLESQSNYTPGYTLEKRGIYYLSRMISSQYNVEFKNSDFDKLKKVYSIWICTHAPSYAANTITEYRFKPENLVGEIPDVPKNYDLMSLIMINLGKRDKNYDGLIRMLDALLNKTMVQEECLSAIDILKNDYNITLRSYNGEVDSMCNLSQGIYNDGINVGMARGMAKGRAEGMAKGRAEGMAKGRAEGMAKGRADGKNENAVEVVGKLLAIGVPFEKALDIAGIDEETYRKYNTD